MAQTDTARLLTPLGFLGALAVAAGVWFIPLPGPDEPGEVISVGPGSSAGAEGAGVQPVGRTPDHDWLALVPPLSKLRSELVEPEPDQPIVETPDQPPVNVRYLGFVGAGEDRSAALIEIDGTQRFVSTGDAVSLEGRDDLVIEEITPEKVVYSMGSVNNTVPRSTRNTGSAPSARPLPVTPTPSPDEDRLRGTVSTR